MKTPPTPDPERARAARRRLGWAALAVAVAATTAIVPPLVLPQPPDAAAPRPGTSGAAVSPSAVQPATEGLGTVAPSTGPPSPAATSSRTPGASAGGSRSAGAVPTPAFAVAVHAADEANIRRGARIIECASCDGGSRVGYIGGPNTLAIRVDGVPAAGERTLVVVYETAVPRTLMIAVNDGAVQSRTLSGAGDYAIPARISVTVSVPAGTSWIRFFNDAGDAPDINRIELR